MGTPTRSESRLRFFLRDFRVLEGVVGLGAGASLISLLASRKSYISLTDARWTGAEQAIDHLVLRVAQVIWVAAPAGDVPLVNAPLAVAPTAADLQLDGGLVIRGGLPLAPHQRLGDYLESAGPFLPVHQAVLLRSRHGGKPVGAALGDVAISQAMIEGAWEPPAGPPAEKPAEPAPAAEQAPQP